MAGFQLDSRGGKLAACAASFFGFILGLICCLGIGGLTLFAPARAATLSTSAGDAPPAAATQAPAEFAPLVAKVEIESDGPPRDLEASEEQALAILDSTALAALNMQAPDLDALNRRLAQMVTRQPALGEGYRVMRLAGNPAAYALVANFGVAGPSAIRVYAGNPGKLALAGRVDRFSQPAYADNYLEVLPWNGADPPGLFLTISGRTDGEQTGVFGAWRFNGRDVNYVWVSDILVQSSYELNANGFSVTYCLEPDANDPSKCLHRERDRFNWDVGGWRQLEATDLPGDAAGNAAGAEATPGGGANGGAK